MHPFDGFRELLSAECHQVAYATPFVEIGLVVDLRIGLVVPGGHIGRVRLRRLLAVGYVGLMGRIVVATIPASRGIRANQVAAPPYPPVAARATEKDTGPKAVAAMLTNAAVP